MSDRVEFGDDEAEEAIAAFRLFLEGVGGSAEGGLIVKDRQKVLAALDVLDPPLAEKLSKRWGVE